MYRFILVDGFFSFCKICELYFQIVVSLLNERPNADNFSYSTVLQEFTKATNIRLRFLRTKTLLGHLMSVARQDPTVTRRYFYSIKDINIGGRCVCNGHAETCDLTDPREPYKLLCRCKHNTCGSKCEECCPGYQQKKWRRAIIDSPFICEREYVLLYMRRPFLFTIVNPTTRTSVLPRPILSLLGIGLAVDIVAMNRLLNLYKFTVVKLVKPFIIS